MIPNIITCCRLLLVPVIFFLLLSPHFINRLLGLILFIIAALTDWLDGFIARKYDQVTELGKVFDPLADRVLIVFVGVSFFINHMLPLWSLGVLLGREIIVVLGFVFLSRLGIKMAVSSMGKKATAFLLISFIFLLLDLLLGLSILLLAGRILFYLGLLLYIASAIDYLNKGAVFLKWPKRTS